MSNTIITNYVPPKTVNTIVIRGPQGAKGDGGDGSINEVGLVSDGTIIVEGARIDGNHPNGTFTVKLPQAIETTSSPIFANITINGEAIGITKSMVGLSEVDNTSDANKPVSIAQAAEFSSHATALDTHKTDVANPHSVTKAQVGLSEVDNTSDANKPVSIAQAAALNEHKTDVANPHSVTKAQVGLSEVDNTSDANKPVSIAQQTAIDLKANWNSPNTTGTLTHDGDIAVSGVGRRIKGDFSNATIEERTIVQSSVSGGDTIVGLIPNDTGSVSAINLSNSSDPANSSILQASINNSSASISSTSVGTGSALPFTILVANEEQLRIDADGVVTLNNSLVLPVNDNFSLPPTNTVKLFGRSFANRSLPAFVGPTGLHTAIQPADWRQKIGRWNPQGAANTAPTLDGISAFTVQGTATARTVTTTNLFGRAKRIGYVSAATAGSLCGLYNTIAHWTTGDGAGLGGFFYSIRFGFSDATALAAPRAFVGMSATVAAATNVNPDTLVNSFGVAQLATDTTQLYFVCAGSTAQTAIPLGTNFPPMAAAGATNGILYELAIYCAPSSDGVVNLHLENVGTNESITTQFAPETVGVQTPASTTLLAPRAWRCNNTAAAAVGIDIGYIYIETDY